MPDSPERRRERERDLKARGICVRCRINPAIPENIRCQACTEKENTRYKTDEAYRQRKIAARKKRDESRSRATKDDDNKKKTQRRAKQRERILDAYGRQCACCGETIPQFLTVDHIEGGGNLHRQSLSTTGDKNYRIYGWLIRNNFPPGFQLLCWNCNIAKGMYGRCPHTEGTHA